MFKGPISLYLQTCTGVASIPRRRFTNPRPGTIRISLQRQQCLVLKRVCIVDQSKPKQELSAPYYFISCQSFIGIKYILKVKNYYFQPLIRLT